MIDEFASRFVYFYTGYLLAPRIFALAARRAGAARGARSPASPSGALVNGLLVFNGLAELPFVSLALGLVGAVAVVAVSALLAQERPVRAAALLRTELDRHLSRLLPADGGDAARCCSRPA